MRLTLKSQTLFRYVPMICVRSTRSTKNVFGGKRCSCCIEIDWVLHDFLRSLHEILSVPGQRQRQRHRKCIILIGISKIEIRLNIFRRRMMCERVVSGAVIYKYCKRRIEILMCGDVIDDVTDFCRIVSHRTNCKCCYWHFFFFSNVTILQQVFHSFVSVCGGVRCTL